mgnify:CR=1 FL=1
MNAPVWIAYLAAEAAAAADAAAKAADTDTDAVGAARPPLEEDVEGANGGSGDREAGEARAVPEEPGAAANTLGDGEGGGGAEGGDRAATPNPTPPAQQPPATIDLYVSAGGVGCHMRNRKGCAVTPCNLAPLHRPEAVLLAYRTCTHSLQEFHPTTATCFASAG